MSKIIASKITADKAYLAVVDGSRIVSVKSFPTSVLMLNEESIGKEIKNACGKAKFRLLPLALTIKDEDCFTKEIDGKNYTKANIELNLPYEFKEYIQPGHEGDYVYDYQSLPDQGEKKNRLLAVAGKRIAIEKLKVISRTAGLALTSVVPESIALGDIVSKSKGPNARYIIIDFGLNKITVRIYNGREVVAFYETEDGVRCIQDLLKNKNMSVYDANTDEHYKVYETEKCQKYISDIINNTLEIIDFYDERKISDSKSTGIFIMGEGAMMTPLVNLLKESTMHKCQNIRALLNGNISKEDAAMLAPAIAAAYKRN